MSGGPKTWAWGSHAPFGNGQRGARLLGSGGKLTGNPERVMQTSLLSQVRTVYQGARCPTSAGRHVGQPDCKAGQTVLVGLAGFQERPNSVVWTTDRTQHSVR